MSSFKIPALLASLFVFAENVSAQHALVGNAASTNVNGAVWNMQRSGLTNVNAFNASSISTTGTVAAAFITGNGGALTHVITSNLDGTIGAAQMPSAAQTYEDTRLITHANENITNLNIGGALIFASTTNAVNCSIVGDPNMLGNFQTNALPGILTNAFTHSYLALISGIWYFTTTNGTLQYSSAVLFTTNWTKINGAYPVPTTIPAVIFDPSKVATIGSSLGAQFFGFTPLTPAADFSSNLVIQLADQQFASNAAINVLLQSNIFNGTGVTNTALQVLARLPVISVSSRGIINGLSSITNNGCPFGPDTPGTTTYGVNEALSALPVSTGTFRPGGGSIQFDGGQYYTTGVITPPTNRPAAYSFTGSGLLGTMVVYGGASSNAVWFGSVPGDDTPFNVYWDRVSVVCTNNIAAACIYSKNTSLHVHDSCFGFLPQFYQTLIQPGLLQMTAEPNIVGIDLSSSAGGQSFIEHNYFIACAVGLKLTGDWCYINGNHFEGISDWFSDAGETENFNNLRSTNTIESLGAAIILLPSANSHYEVFQNQFYECNIAFATTLDQGVLHSGFNNFESVATVWNRATNITAKGWFAVESELVSFDGIRVGGGPNVPQIAQSFISSPSYLGNAAGLTNITAIKGLSASANLSFTPTPNADGSTNVAVAITGALPMGNLSPNIQTNTISFLTSTNGYFYPSLTNNGVITWTFIETNTPASNLTGALPIVLQMGFMNQLSAEGFNDNQYTPVQGPVNGNGGLAYAQTVLIPGTYTNFYFNWMFPNTSGGTNCSLQIYTNAPGGTPTFAMGVTNFGPMSSSANNGASNLFSGFKVGPNTMGCIRMADNGGLNIATVYFNWSIQRY